MYRVNILAFDDFTADDVDVYTPEHYNKILGQYDQLNIMAMVDQAPGATLTVAVEHSGDGRNWLQKNATPEINAVPIYSIAIRASEPNIVPSLGFVRLRVMTSGTGGKVKINVTARDRGAGKPIREDVEIPIGAVVRAPMLGAGQMRVKGHVRRATANLKMGLAQVAAALYQAKPRHQPAAPPLPPSPFKRPVALDDTKGADYGPPFVGSDGKIYFSETRVHSSDGGVTISTFSLDGNGNYTFEDSITFSDDNSGEYAGKEWGTGTIPEWLGDALGKVGSGAGGYSGGVGADDDDDMVGDDDDDMVGDDDDDMVGDDDDGSDDDNGDEDDMVGDDGDDEDDMVGDDDGSDGMPSDDGTNDALPQLNLHGKGGSGGLSMPFRSSGDGTFGDSTAPEQPFDPIALMRSSHSGVGVQPGGSGVTGWGDSTSDESPGGIDPKTVRAGHIVSSADDSGWGDLNHPNAFIA